MCLFAKFLENNCHRATASGSQHRLGFHKYEPGNTMNLGSIDCAHALFPRALICFVFR